MHGETTSHPTVFKMKVTTILGYEFTTIESLKAFAVAHGFTPIGKKPLKAAWIESVRFYLESQIVVVAIVAEADPIASVIAITIEDTAVKVGTVVVKALTSEAAVLGYRVVLKTVAFALVMAWLVTVATAKWCWAHRSSTAVYHWVNDALASEFALSAVTYLMLGEWVLVEWIDSIRSAIDSGVQSCRVALISLQSRVNGLVEDARSVVG